jgi:hypothetical protein
VTVDHGSSANIRAVVDHGPPKGVESAFDLQSFNVRRTSTGFNVCHATNRYDVHTYTSLGQTAGKTTDVETIAHWTLCAVAWITIIANVKRRI